MSFALGFAAFFAASLLRHLRRVLIYNTATHHAIDFALTYKRVRHCRLDFWLCLW